MEERPPSRPRVAWAESGAPQERRPPPEPYEVTEVQSLHGDAEEENEEMEKETIDTIQSFLGSTEKVLLPFTTSQRKTVHEMDMEQIWKLCGFMASSFSQEPFGQLLQPSQRTDVVLMALEKTAGGCCVEDSEWAKIILDVVLRQPGIWLMDVPVIMAFIHRHLKSKKTSIQQTLFSVLDVLAYQFPRDVLTAVLIHLPQSDSTTLDMWKSMLYFPRSSGRVLEVLCTVLKEEDLCGIPTAELDLVRLTVPEILASIHRNLKSPPTLHQPTFLSLLDMLACQFPRNVLTCVLTHLPQNDSTTLDMWKSMLSSTRSSERVLEMLFLVFKMGTLCGIPTAELDLLHLTVPEILGSIHRNLKRSRASLQETLFSLLDMLTRHFPRDVLMSVLTHLPQCDSTTLDIWESLLAPAATSERVLEELCSVLQDQQLCMTFNFTTVDFGLLRLTVMRPTEEILQELCNPDLFEMFLKIKSLPLLWLVLRGLVLLSERPETAREIRALLPDIMETLQFGNVHVTLNALNIFRNMMNHLGKMVLRPITLELADKLLHLFNHVSGEVRESSILLFQDVMEAVVWWQKGKMRKNVRRGLLPLLFRNSDETSSVAEAAGETLLACAKFLNWQELKHQAEKRNMVGIRECLLQQDRKRVDKYLQQSLLYLRDSQAAMRQEALSFIGLAWVYWDQSEEMRKKIYSVLHPLEHDSHPTIRSLATSTILMLRYSRQQAKSGGGRLVELCCWPCNPLFRHKYD
ncbi:uncharacterized protein LOC107049283 [Gallus gallus]|uniref:uncharacterized protein LOC107049283 n=1 Tax=Gallus gallus TaxID=9031 RepID=UPI001AE40B72|nr:uncharacterized protein LOC107049283 [Gallus gallus]XP_046792858.1 uncharacterized protein LOC107049283 [Gallus gallus]